MGESFGKDFLLQKVYVLSSVYIMQRQLLVTAIKIRKIFGNSGVKTL